MSNKLNLEFWEYTGHEFKWRDTWRDWLLLSLSSWDSWVYDIFYQEWNNAYVNHYKWWEHTGWWENIWTYEGFWIWLSQVLTIEVWEAIDYQCFYAPEEPILTYIPIDEERGRFTVAYESDDYPRSEWVKSIDIEITKEELLKTFYVSLVKRIAECYKWVERYKWNLNDCESLFGFFNRDIDDYLRNHWVDDIDELVKKARNKIKGDIQEVYEMYDDWYYNWAPKSEWAYIAEEFRKYNED